MLTVTRTQCIYVHYGRVVLINSNLKYFYLVISLRFGTNQMDLNAASAKLTHKINVDCHIVANDNHTVKIQNNAKIICKYHDKKRKVLSSIILQQSQFVHCPYKKLVILF